MNTVNKQIVPFTKQPYTNYEICFKHQILKHVLVGMHQYYISGIYMIGHYT